MTPFVKCFHLIIPVHFPPWSFLSWLNSTPRWEYCWSLNIFEFIEFDPSVRKFNDACHKMPPPLHYYQPLPNLTFPSSHCKWWWQRRRRRWRWQCWWRWWWWWWWSFHQVISEWILPLTLEAHFQSNLKWNGRSASQPFSSPIDQNWTFSPQLIHIKILNNQHWLNLFPIDPHWLKNQSILVLHCGDGSDGDGGGGGGDDGGGGNRWWWKELQLFWWNGARVQINYSTLPTSDSYCSIWILIIVQCDFCWNINWVVIVH